MTGELDTIRRLRAWHAGRPIPRGETLNVHVGDDDQILCISFVRMGGESLPWGVAWGGASDSQPQVLTVPDPRNRDLVADMMVIVGRRILEHFGHPRYDREHDDGPSTYEFRQIWVPNQTHLEMLHSLAFAYARTNWDRPDVEVLRDLGTLANCLFVESQRPGQQTVMVASSALSAVHSFPTSPVREAHLGHQLAWFDRAKDRSARLASARQAERTPVATSLEPDFERKNLVPIVEKWNAYPRAERVRKGKREASAIAKVLTSELEHRHRLVTTAIETLRRDKRRANPGLRDLVRIGREAFSKLWWDNVLKQVAGDPANRPFWPGLWGDLGPGSAAYSYHARSAAAAESRQLLVHGDRTLQDEELLAGHGLRVTVTSVELRGASWNARFDFPEIPSLKVGGSFSIAGSAVNSSKASLKIIDFDLDARTIVLEPTWKSARAALGTWGLARDDHRWVGRTLVLVDDFPPDFTMRLAGRSAKHSAHSFDVLTFFDRVENRDENRDDSGDEIRG